MTWVDALSLIKDAAVGGMSLALFFRLGKVVAQHEIRISALEGEQIRALRARRPRRR